MQEGELISIPINFVKNNELCLPPKANNIIPSFQPMPFTPNRSFMPPNNPPQVVYNIHYNYTNYNTQEKQYELKAKEMSLDRFEKFLQRRDNALKNFDRYLNRKKYTININEGNLLKKEKELNDKEKELNDKEKELNDREIILNEMKENLTKSIKKELAITTFKGIK